MRVVVSGGHGRLGRLMVPWLESRGLDVYAPTRAELDWTSPTRVYDAIQDSDRVLALASWTDVAGAQRDPDGCVRDTVQTVQATLRAASRTNTQIRYLGTDYTLSLERGGHGAGWYTAAKSVAERLVLLGGHSVARVAFTTPEQVQGWGWVDGLSRSTRCWVEDLLPQVGAWVLMDQVPSLVRLGGSHPVTLADLLRERYPDHPALLDVVTDPEELRRRGGGTRPPDTSW